MFMPPRRTELTTPEKGGAAQSATTVRHALSCTGETKHGDAPAGAGPDPDGGYLAVSRRFRARPCDPDVEQRPGKPRGDDGRDRRPPPVDVERGTRQQAGRRMDRRQPSWGSAQRRPRIRRAMVQRLRTALLAAPADSLRDPRARGPDATGYRPDGRHAVSQYCARDRAMVPRPCADGGRLDARNTVPRQQGSGGVAAKERGEAQGGLGNC